MLDGELVPVPSFRDHTSLSVGEVVFKIGSPQGLINTVAEGLLSGLRRSEDGIEYIQITAPLRKAQVVAACLMTTASPSVLPRS